MSPARSLATALVLIASTLVTGAAAGAGARSPGRAALVLEAPVTMDERAVWLGGEVTRQHDRVALQRRRAGRWVTVRTLRADQRTYGTRVRRGAEPRRYRTVAGRLVSRVRVVPARAATPPPPPASTADACGPRILKADGTAWSCTFADDFDGTSLDRSAWLPADTAADGYRSGDVLTGIACYRDDPANVAVSGGALHLTLRRLSAAQPCPGALLGVSPYTSGSVSTHHRFSQQYGRFEARMRSTASAQPGLQEAFWLWPDARDASGVLWPAAGEIDVAETYSLYSDLVVPFLHYTADDNGGPVPGLNTAWDCRAQRGEWNTYALEWTASRLTVLVNGTTCLVNTSGDSAFRKRYILALTQLIGSGANAPGLLSPFTGSATTSVDHVRVWS